MSSQNSKTNFWQYIQTLNWDIDSENTTTLKERIMKELSPILAQEYDEILNEFHQQLMEKYIGKYANYKILNDTIFNIIGCGKDIYESSIYTPKVVDQYYIRTDAAVLPNFRDIFPTADSYFCVNQVDTVFNDFEEDDY